MLPGNAIVTGRRRVATAFVFFMFLTVIAESNNSQASLLLPFNFFISFIFLQRTSFYCAVRHEWQVRCSKTCVAENCNCEPVNDSLVKTLFHFIFVFIFIFYYSKCVAAVGIKYGKYCGVGWTGCPGEKPCDDLDACCKIHDECVEKKGIFFITGSYFVLQFFSQYFSLFHFLNMVNGLNSQYYHTLLRIILL